MSIRTFIDIYYRFTKTPYKFHASRTKAKNRFPSWSKNFVIPLVSIEKLKIGFMYA